MASTRLKQFWIDTIWIVLGLGGATTALVMQHKAAPTEDAAKVQLAMVQAAENTIDSQADAIRKASENIRRLVTEKISPETIPAVEQELRVIQIAENKAATHQTSLARDAIINAVSNVHTHQVSSSSPEVVKLAARKEMNTIKATISACTPLHALAELQHEENKIDTSLRNTEAAAQKAFALPLSSIGLGGLTILLGSRFIRRKGPGL